MIFKRILGMVLIMAAFISCKPQGDYKKDRDEVIKVHDLVMADHGKVVDKQLALEDMLKDLRTLKAKNLGIDTLKEKDSIIIVRDRLEKAEEAMNTWMHEFEPDVTGKSNEEAIAYFRAEKDKIQQVDSMFKKELKSTDSYLRKFKK
jgi:hypothetical protein